jgi:two-component system LytT family sensor kinase
METLLRGRWTRWALFLLGWAALSLLFAPEAYLTFYLRKAPISWVETVELTVINSAIALLFVPGIVYLTRRFPIERGRWQRSLALHVFACLAFSVGHSWLYAVACHAWRDVGETLFVRFHPNLITYWAIVGFTQAFEYFRKYQQRERDITRLQLQALKAQLQPHFLFNALNTVTAMMHVDVKRADRMLSRLSELLRMTLASIERQEVRLAEEIAYVEAYLDIERERFGDRLALRIEAAPETLDALVPALFLQPLVENSVRHGFASPERDGLVEIRAGRVDSRLMLTVTDNGRGLAGEAPPREGVGISNARKRLAQLYGESQSFGIAARAPRGVEVTVELPFHKELHEHPSADRGRRVLGTHTDQLAAER